jgi:hypothetical protein
MVVKEGILFSKSLDAMAILKFPLRRSCRWHSRHLRAGLFEILESRAETPGISQYMSQSDLDAIGELPGRCGHKPSSGNVSCRVSLNSTFPDIECQVRTRESERCKIMASVRTGVSYVRRATGLVRLVHPNTVNR